ncbi:MAG: glycosyltransferase family 39 protein [Nitrospirae bacterium]|nr:glycosyltransferase family 39 protein [Nitrospirota bacterium]
MCNDKRNRLVYTLAIIVFFIRVGSPLIDHLILGDLVDRFYSDDSISYMITAKSLAFDHKFNNMFGKSEIIRTPGYPLLIVPGMLLDHPELITIFIQSILSCLTIFMIYKISLEVFNNINAALLSTFLASIDRVLLHYSYVLDSETLYTFILTLFMYTIILYFKNKQLRYIIISSILLAMSIYVRPVGYYMPLVFVFSVFVYLIYKKELTKKIILHLLVFCMITCIAVSLWQIRNFKTTGYSGFSAIEDVNFYYYNACSLMAEQNGISFQDMLNKLSISTFYYNTNEDIIDAVNKSEGILFKDQAQAYKYIKHKAIRIILNDPLTYAKIHLKGMFNLLQDNWFPFETKWALRNQPEDISGLTGLIMRKGIKGAIFLLSKEQPLLLMLYILYSLGVLLSYIGVMITVFNKRIDGVFVLTIVAVYIVIICGGIWGCARFRHPMLPSFYVLGGMGLLTIYNKIHKALN